MKSIGEQKEEKFKVFKEKSKKWEVLQRQKDEATTKFEQVRKQDESLHAELVETNKRRKANIASTKMVIYYLDCFKEIMLNLHVISKWILDYCCLY
jgi:hypothetical protein